MVSTHAQTIGTNSSVVPGAGTGVQFRYHDAPVWERS